MYFILLGPLLDSLNSGLGGEVLHVFMTHLEDVSVFLCVGFQQDTRLVVAAGHVASAALEILKARTLVVEGAAPAGLHPPGSIALAVC